MLVWYFLDYLVNSQALDGMGFEMSVDKARNLVDVNKCVNLPEVGLELGIIGSQVVQFLVGLECFRRQAQGGVVEPEQLCNSHMARGTRQIHGPMTHVVLRACVLSCRQRENTRRHGEMANKQRPRTRKYV